MTVGQRIREKRIELGLSQTDLALRMGYSGKSSVCAAEICGDNITTTKVEKFAKALGVSVKYLMFGEDELPSSSNKDVSIDYDTSKIAEAINLYNVYEQASPEVRSAIDVLLRSAQQVSQATAEIPYVKATKPRAELPYLKKDIK